MYYDCERFYKANGRWVCASGYRNQARWLYPHELSETAVNRGAVKGSSSLMTGVWET